MSHAGGPGMSIQHFHGFRIFPGERRIIRKDELLDPVWPGVVVEQNDLQVQISRLRKHLGAMAIATIPGRGYQFTAQSINPSGPHGTGAGYGSAAVPRPGDASVDGVCARESRLGNIAQVRPPVYGRETEWNEV